MTLQRLPNKDWRLNKWQLMMTIPPSFTSAEQILFVTKQVSTDNHLERSQWKKGYAAGVLRSRKLEIRWRDRQIPGKKNLECRVVITGDKWDSLCQYSPFRNEGVCFILLHIIRIINPAHRVKEIVEYGESWTKTNFFFILFVTFLQVWLTFFASL